MVWTSQKNGCVQKIKKISGNVDDWRKTWGQTINMVARPSQERQIDKDSSGGILKKCRNGQMETAGDPSAKVDSQEWK
jgi:hypothetical protein